MGGLIAKYLKAFEGEAETWCKHKIDLWENEEIFVTDFKNKYWFTGY